VRFGGREAIRRSGRRKILVPVGGGEKGEEEEKEKKLGEG
jgi:hypothetical protein